jgi:hypothetical protein
MKKMERGRGNKDKLSLKLLRKLSSLTPFKGSLMSEPRRGEQEPNYNSRASMKNSLFLNLHPI